MTIGQQLVDFQNGGVNLGFSSAMPNGGLRSQFATSSVSLLFVRKGKGQDF